MKVIVAIKQVLDQNVSIDVRSDCSGLEAKNIKMSINPFCEIALEEAVRLKERGRVSEIIAISIGPKTALDQLRGAIALGADRGVLIDCSEKISSLVIAKLLRSIIEQEAPELILLGRQSIDSDNNQTGQMLASLMGLPQATFAYRISLKENSVVVHRQLDSGVQVVSLDLPAIVTTELTLNEPRYISLINIMRAKKKIIRILTPSELGVSITSTTKTIKVELPCIKDKQCKILKSVKELSETLKREIKVG